MLISTGYVMHRCNNDSNFSNKIIIMIMIIIIIIIRSVIGRQLCGWPGN